MQNLDKRIAVLEAVKPRRSASSMSDDDLMAIIAGHVGHVPSDDELQALVAEGAKDGRSN